ncbi:PadR family transcriptional regulator [Flindersiella endophytica]
MSIRYGLLALLEAGPKHGYQLRGEFEQATGGTWPLNVGQVYSTLSRLERDGLVTGVSGEESDENGRVRYQITKAGDADLRLWLRTPISREARPRDELAIKLALALSVPGADVHQIVQTQRTATIRTLQEYTRLKRTPGKDELSRDLSWSLVLDSLIFAAEAEVRWLDHCESRLARAAAEPRPQRPSTGSNTEESEHEGIRHER